jgi:uncharacterized LabA/DUF88 family protein
MNQRPQDRVIVFIDYQNVFAGARSSFHQPPYAPTDGQDDPVALGNLLVGRRVRPSRLQQVRIYRGLPDASREPRPYGANDRQTAAWRRSPLVEVLRRPLRYPADWPATKAKEKGVDVALAIDFVRLAVQGAYDVGVLFSTDTDMVPALEAVMELRTVGAHVEVAAWTCHGHRRSRLRLPDTDLPWCHYLTEADYRQVADVIDYASPPRGPH